MNYIYYHSPVGVLGIAEDGEGLTYVTSGSLPIGPEWKEKESALLRKTAEELDEYFQGRRRQFDLPLHPKGTEFQKRAWKILCEIPYGSTISYGEEARRMGCKSARPVGGANGKNPIMILIPCHRVIASDGTLHGYSGGLFIKKYLLTLEGAHWKE